MLLWTLMKELQSVEHFAHLPGLLHGEVQVICMEKSKSAMKMYLLVVFIKSQDVIDILPCLVVKNIKSGFRHIEFKF